MSLLDQLKEVQWQITLSAKPHTHRPPAKPLLVLKDSFLVSTSDIFTVLLFLPLKQDQFQNCYLRLRFQANWPQMRAEGQLYFNALFPNFKSPMIKARSKNGRASMWGKDRYHREPSVPSSKTEALDIPSALQWGYGSSAKTIIKHLSIGILLLAFTQTSSKHTSPNMTRKMIPFSCKLSGIRSWWSKSSPQEERKSQDHRWRGCKNDDVQEHTEPFLRSRPAKSPKPSKTILI